MPITVPFDRRRFLAGSAALGGGLALAPTAAFAQGTPRRGGTLRMSVDQAAAKLQKGLRVFLRDDKPLEPVAKRLEGKGDGEVCMVLQLGGGAEVEIRLPGRFKVSPQIAGAIKAVPGVLVGQLM